MKTPEHLAEEYLNQDTVVCAAIDRDAEDLVKDAFLAGYKAGYKAGREITDQEIIDILVDIREREARERSKLPPLQQERHDRIWERIKVKLVGIF